MSYTVIENFIPEALENVLANMYHHDMEWNYVSETSGNTEDMVDDLDPRVLECPQLCHISHWGGVDNPKTFGVQRMVLYFLELYTGCKITDINKIKTNMNLMDPRYKDKYHPPHADHRAPEWTSMVYYIIDSDGPTRFFNKSTLDKDPHSNLEVIGEVHPKKGRAVIFPSNIMHTGTCPQKTENRLVTNYVFHAPELKFPIVPKVNIKLENFE